MPWREKNPNLGFRQPALNQAEILNSFQLRRKHLKRSWNVFQLFFPGAETIIIRWIMEYNIRYSIKPFSSILPIQRLRMYCLIAWFFFSPYGKKMMNSVFLIDFICKRQRKRDREKKMQATRMRCRPQSRAPAPRCFVLPSRSVSHATNFVGDIQWGAMQDFFSLFLNLCMDFIFTRCSVNTAILCAFGWCYNLFFLIHRAESITRCEKKIL